MGVDGRGRREHRDRGEGEEPRDVRVEPVGEDELEAGEQRRGERGELERRLVARDERGDERADDEQHLEHVLHRMEVGEAARVVLPPVPQREGRARARSATRRVRSQNTRSSCSGLGSSRTTEKAATVAAAKPAMKRPEGRRPGYVSQSGATMSEANLVHPDSAPSAPRPTGDETSQKPKMRKHGIIASFVFELDAYCVNGYAAHANASVAPSRAPAEPAADEPEPEHRRAGRRRST